MIQLSNSAISAIALALLLTPAAAHEAPDQPEGAAKLHVRNLEELGPAIVDRAGVSLYLFEADKQGREGADPESTCTEECAQAWPPLVTEGGPEAHDDLNPDLLGTLERHDGELQVTYNGWPLYYFASDMGPGHARGHDIEANGGEWYLVTPDGEKAGETH